MLDDPLERKVEEFRNLIACWPHTRTYCLNMVAWTHCFLKKGKKKLLCHSQPHFSWSTLLSQEIRHAFVVLL